MKRIRKVLLVFPSMVFQRAQSRKTAIMPLGLAQLAAALEGTREVRILDSALEGYGRETDQPNGLTNYGLTDEEYRRVLAEFRPDLVGVSCLFSSLHNQTLRVARLAKAVDPEVITVAGGPHPSALPRLLLRDPALDFCVVGEGERPLLGLIQRLESGQDLSDLDGVAYRAGGEVRVNSCLNLVEDLDTLPFPAYHLVKLEEYFRIGSVQGLRMEDKRLRLVQVTTSRGCPYACSYCGKYAVWGKRHRTMGAARVLDLLEMLVDRHQAQRIAFQDDNLTFDRRRALELFRGMAARRLPLTWEAHNGLAFSNLDEELLDAMAQSGCVSFTGAVESGSEEVLKKINKKVDLERAIALRQYAGSLGLDVRAFYIIGFPGETRGQIEATRAHMRRMKASVSALALYTPLPGSPLYRQLEESGVIDSARMDFEKLSFGAFDLQLSEVTVPDLHRIRKIDWILNVFADDHGNLRSDLQVPREVMVRELANGLALYPDAPELQRLHAQAMAS
jgi:anaerobic magnesium-protoporphyrin IX monomethyl ester cyclase